MSNPANTLCFVPLRNTPGKKDATGAFQPEANKFIKYHGIPARNLYTIDNKLSRGDIRDIIYQAMGINKPENVAFFCHGWKHGIQLGLDLGNLDLFDTPVNNAPHVILYACSTAKGEDIYGNGGFADKLRDRLCEKGMIDCVIDAHFTAGHTTKNPFIRRFEGRGSIIGGVGGVNIVSSSNSPYWAKWRNLLQKTAFRYAFPFLSFAEVYSILDGKSDLMYPTL